MMIATLLSLAPLSSFKAVTSTAVLSSSQSRLFYPYLQPRGRPRKERFLFSAAGLPTLCPDLSASAPRITFLTHAFDSSAAVSAEAFTGGAIWRDAGATVAVMAGAYVLVSIFDILTQRNVIPQNLSRKLVHILSGLLFLASWPIFRIATHHRLATLLH